MPPARTGRPRSASSTSTRAAKAAGRDEDNAGDLRLPASQPLVANDQLGAAAYHRGGSRLATRASARPWPPAPGREGRRRIVARWVGTIWAQLGTISGPRPIIGWTAWQEPDTTR